MIDGSYDVVIVGAGPSGCVAAVSLARRGYTVCLADASSKRMRVADILAPDVVRLLCSWVPVSKPAQDVVRPCRGVLTRWGRAEPNVTDYDLLSRGPAWIVTRPSFDRVMLAAAAGEVAAVREGWTAMAALRDGAAYRVFFASSGQRQHVLTARALVYATGRSTSFPSAPRTYEDRQVAISTLIAGVQLHDLLWVESGTRAWWYLNDVPGGGAQLVWVTEYHPALRTAESRAEAMLSRARELPMIGSVLPRNLRIADATICDARLSRIVTAPGGDCFYSGDAAETSDPLSGRGWHRAMTSALATAAAIDRALSGETKCAPPLPLRQAFSDHVAARTLQWAAAYGGGAERDVGLTSAP